MVGWKVPVICFTMQKAVIFKMFLLVDLGDESCLRCTVLGVTVCLWPALYNL